MKPALVSSFTLTNPVHTHFLAVSPTHAVNVKDDLKLHFFLSEILYDVTQ